MGVVVFRILDPATCVADFRVNDSGHITQNFLDAPETATGKHGHLCLFPTRVSRDAHSVLIIHTGSPSLVLMSGFPYRQYTWRTPQKLDGGQRTMFIRGH